MICRLVPNWNRAHKMWSIRLSLFWAAVSGLWVAMPAFQDVLSPLVYAGLCIVLSAAVCVARLTHQPGVSE